MFFVGYLGRFETGDDDRRLSTNLVNTEGVVLCTWRGSIDESRRSASNNRVYPHDSSHHNRTCPVREMRWFDLWDSKQESFLVSHTVIFVSDTTSTECLQGPSYRCSGPKGRGAIRCRRQPNFGRDARRLGLLFERVVYFGVNRPFSAPPSQRFMFPKSRRGYIHVRRFCCAEVKV